VSGKEQLQGGWSRPVALVAASAFFMETFDATVLVTAAPAIAYDFGVEAADIGVAMTAYLLAVAVFIPVSGWAADRWGARRVLCAAIVCFVFASLLCALSTSLPMLTVARVLQGIGGSMMVPVGRLIVLKSTSKSELIRVIAYLTWPALIAPVIAPLAGGVITQFVGWPWIFYINLPLGVVLVIAALIVIPRDGDPSPRKLDTVGLFGVSATTVSLLLGLEFVADSERAFWGVGLLGTALLTGVFSIRRLMRVPSPFLDLSNFQAPSFRVTNSSGVLYRAAVSSAPFLLPLLMQEGFGWSPVLAGAMVMWIFVGNLVVKPATTWMIRTFGFRAVMMVSALGVAATFLATALMSKDTPIVLMAGVFLISGVFRSTGFSAYGTLQFADVPSVSMNGANTLSSTLVQLASGLGIALAVVVIRLVELVPGLGELAGYRGALVLMAVIAGLSAIGAQQLPPGTGDQVRKRILVS
jgi:EmrB/QacA subfamily drug resistance transporter